MARPKKAAKQRQTALAIVEKINKKHGEGTIVLGSEIHYDNMPRITTGSLSLDVALGGGFPCNQWNEIIGEESHGKTALVLKVIAANQAIDPDWFTVWVAAEEYVPEWAAKLGVDNERVLVLQNNSMEFIYDAVVEFLDSRQVDCIVIDSLPALIPKAEEDADSFEDQFIGLGARITNRFFRVNSKATKRNLTTEERPVTGFMINQYREKIGVMYGDNRTTPGGRGKNFAYFTRAEVRRAEWIEAGDERVGQVIKVRCVKNKSAPPQRVATIDFYFADCAPFSAGDYDTVKEIMTLAISNNVIERGGAYYKYGEDRWQGREALLAEMMEDLTLRKNVSDEVLTLLTNQKKPLKAKQALSRSRRGTTGASQKEPKTRAVGSKKTPAKTPRRLGKSVVQERRRIKRPGSS